MLTLWFIRTISSEVAPVHVTLPEDHIDAVLIGLRSFIVTIPFSRLNSTLRPCNAISFNGRLQRTLKAHTTLLITISTSGSGSSVSSIWDSVGSWKRKKSLLRELKHQQSNYGRLTICSRVSSSSHCVLTSSSFWLVSSVCSFLTLLWFVA